MLVIALFLMQGCPQSDNLGEAADIKILAFDGTAPTPETILSREYPFAINYYAVVQKDLPENHPARKIADWLTTNRRPVGGRRCRSGSVTNVIRAAAVR